MKSQLCFRDAFQDALPVVVSGFVFGLVFGVLAVKAGLTVSAATLMSLLVFAGASQFIVVEQWQNGQFSLIAVLMTTLLVNLRHLVMSLSLRLSFHGESRKRLAPAFSLLLIDETWALAEHRFKRSAPSLRYFIQVGFLIYCGWVGGTLLGTQLGSRIPEPAAFGLDFTFVAMFLSLMVLLWQRSLDFLTWILSGVIALGVARLPAIGQASAVVAAVVASALVAALSQPEAADQ